jgi:leucyl/phenylalanyl-tRNA---protein transferase
MVQFIPPHKTQWQFPDVSEADEEGVLQVGGNISPARILEAYQKGIFPWYNAGEPVLWWSPNPRFVLFSSELHISRSMQKIMRQNRFEFRTNTAFGKVIRFCKTIGRPGQEGTWITEEMEAVYTDLYIQGYAQSAEAWQNGQLAGGMYGIRIGKVFFGESMFSLVPNASKFAFISCVQQLAAEGIQLIDCQVYSPHVETLGGKLIPRADFIDLLQQSISRDQNLVSI